MREKDDRRRPFVLGEAAGSDSVQGVWRGYGAQVAGRTHTDAAWSGELCEVFFSKGVFLGYFDGILFWWANGCELWSSDEFS